MDFSASERDRLHSELQSALTSVLDSRALKFDIFKDGDSSILVLTTAKEVAGFGIVGSDPISEFQRLYSIFKAANSQNRESWSNFNLSFVLCHPSDNRGFDEFFNQLSTDVYFCRKYVISIGGDLRSELARLHFVPLDHGSVPVPRRPKSAQGVLMSLGVPSDLASSIVTPNKRGDEKLISDCLANKFGAPKVQRASVASSPRATEETFRSDRSIRLTSLTIENFRCYLGRHTFDLDADIVVLYGPNGLGKTSFFDAIDFAATGGSGRFNTRTDAFRRSAQHLDAAPDSCSVSMTVSDTGKTHKYTRRLTSGSKCSVDGMDHDRFEALLALTGNPGEYSEKRVESLVNLFRATHLFGQDYQNLAPDFSSESRLSLDTVSRMLAFQDYVRGIHKLEGLKKGLDSRTDVAANSLENKVSEVADYQKQLEEIDATTRGEVRSTDQAALLKDLRARLSKEENLDLPAPGQKPQETLRSWRASIEGEIQEAEIRQTRTSKLSNDFPAYQTAIKGIASNDKKDGEYKKALLAAQDSLEALNDELKKINARVELAATQEKRLELSQDGLKWQSSSRGSFDSATSNFEKCTARSRVLETKQADFHKRIALTQSGQEKRREKLETLDSRIDELKVALVRSSELMKLAPAWEKAQVRLEELTSKLKTEGVKKQALSDELASLRKQLTQAQAVHATLAADAKLQQDNTQQLSILLDSLEKHVSHSSCPACGQNYNSKEDVLARIAKQRRGFGQEFEETATALKTALASIQDLKKKIGDIELQIHGRQAIIEDLERQTAALRETDAEFEAGANEIDFAIEDELAKELRLTINRGEVLGRLRKAHDALDKNRAAVEKERQELSTEDKKTAVSAKELERQLEATVDDLRIAQGEANRWKLELQKLRAEATQRKLSLDADLKAIKLEADSVATQLGSTRADLSAAQQAAQTKKAAIEKIDTQIADLERAREELADKNDAPNSVIEDFRVALSTVELPQSVTAESIRAARDKAIKGLQTLGKFRDEILRSEVIC